MTEQHDEFHHCPACDHRTRHRVSRDRKLAPVLWCQRCFHVHMETTAPTPAEIPAQQVA
ncbi:hypothetical protein [Magnetospirillum sulfuroxidans]|uniref:Uncharacterized protein n=1 Tax=Magnetospirillum sulfuroxidans TaxID=611300 RepID=A0ABS5I752_9PROT|nr:hypothetical protein [Magnetospirillum sulfuroxidans]MBR9970252.1 hypothetical protein [Magnetospirillum sulfuroxidans]